MIKVMLDTNICIYILIIAAHARSLGIPIITNNVREFERVEGLIVQAWN